MRTPVRRLATLVGAVALVAGGLLAVTAPPLADAAPLPAVHFEWTASGSDTSGDSAFIDTGATNGEPGDVLFVTPNPYRGAHCPCIAVAPLPAIGVRYDRGTGQWAVVIESKSAMPSGESFNVLAEPGTGPSVLVQKATKENSAGK